MSAISDKRDNLLAAGFPLGPAETGEINGPNGGKYQRFQHATIL